MGGAPGAVERLLTRRRVRDFSIAVFAVNALLYVAVVARGTFPFDALGTAVLPDFIAHVSGGVLILRGDFAHLYDLDAQSAVQRAITHDPRFLDLFISPPLAAFLYVPFARLPYAVAAIAWTGVTVVLLLLSARVIRTMTPSLAAADRRLLLVAAMASQPVIQLLGSGQDTGLSLLLWCVGVSLALRRRDGAAGIVFALGLFKPQLFFLPPLVFLALRRWRALGTWTLVAMGEGGLTWLIFGRAGVLGWWQILRSPQYLEFLRGARGVWMTSLMPFVASILPQSGGTMALGIAALGGGVSLAVVLGTFRRVRSGVVHGPVDERGAWALACFATLLASPHLFYYDLTLLALPVALVVEIRGAPSALEKRALLAISLLTWTAAVRAGLASSPWPLRVLAASWTAIPVFLLWREVPCRRPQRAV